MIPKADVISATRMKAEKLLPIFRGMKAGESMTRSEIAKVIEETPCTTKYYQVVRRAVRLFFKESSVKMQTVHGSGIAYPAGIEQMQGGVRKTRNLVRGIGRATAEIAMVSDERLPVLEHRAARDHVVQNMKQLHEVARMARREIELKVSPPQTLPNIGANGKNAD